MDIELRICFLSLIAAVHASHAAAPPNASLIGCWKAVKISQLFPNGSKAEDTSARCSLRFDEGRIESRCGSSGDAPATTYDYRVVRPNVYSATMVGSAYRTDLIGSTREYEYHVDGDRLRIVTKPQTTSPAPPTAAVRVESESTRVACP